MLLQWVGPDPWELPQTSLGQNERPERKRSSRSTCESLRNIRVYLALGLWNACPPNTISFPIHSIPPRAGGYCVGCLGAAVGGVGGPQPESPANPDPLLPPS